jgi:hypothetical protein
VLAGVACIVGGVVLLTLGGAASVGGGALVLVGLVIAIVGGVFGGATRGVFGTALHRYATDARALGPFTPQDLEGAVRST